MALQVSTQNTSFRGEIIKMHFSVEKHLIWRCVLSIPVEIIIIIIIKIINVSSDKQSID